MPEIDKDLYQVLMLALSGIAVLLLLLLVSALGRMRKVLQEQLEETRNLAATGGLGATGTASSEPGLLPSEPLEEKPPTIQTPEPAHYGIDDSDDRPLVGGAAAGVGLASAAESPPEPDRPATEPAASPWDRVDEEPGLREPAAPATEERTPVGDFNIDEPAGADPFSSPQEVQREPERGETAGIGAGAADEPLPTGGAYEPTTTGAAEEPFPGTAGAKTSDPFLTGETEAEENPFMRDADQPAPASTIDEPEEQPFERNGRWYFKREGELLVYEEGTGEWVPAESTESKPTPSSWSASTAGAGESTETGSPTDTAELDAIGDEGESRPASGGFWKCASCGAVNGSSATSCRMCFSARP